MKKKYATSNKTLTMERKKRTTVNDIKVLAERANNLIADFTKTPLFSFFILDYNPTYGGWEIWIRKTPSSRSRSVFSKRIPTAEAQRYFEGLENTLYILMTAEK